MPRKNKKAYNSYMRGYMREHRAFERNLIRWAKQKFPEKALKTPRSGR